MFVKAKSTAIWKETTNNTADGGSPCSTPVVVESVGGHVVECMDGGGVIPAMVVEVEGSVLASER
eukprot:4125620-Amphidinium_carterae.1